MVQCVMGKNVLPFLVCLSKHDVAKGGMQGPQMPLVMVERYNYIILFCVLVDCTEARDTIIIYTVAM